MAHYIYGVATTLMMAAMVNIVDENIPNNLWYYIDIMLPF